MNGANHQMNAVTNFPFYTLEGWNMKHPPLLIRKCFDDELIEILEKFSWWGKSVEEINSLIPILTDVDLLG